MTLNLIFGNIPIDVIDISTLSSKCVFNGSNTKILLIIDRSLEKALNGPINMLPNITRKFQSPPSCEKSANIFWLCNS